MDTLLGLFLLLLGLGLMFFGVRLFLVMLPVFAFLSGFFNGAGAFANWPDGDPFLQTLTGWMEARRSADDLSL